MNTNDRIGRTPVRDSVSQGWKQQIGEYEADFSKKSVEENSENASRNFRRVGTGTQLAQSGTVFTQTTQNRSAGSPVMGESVGL